MLETVLNHLIRNPGSALGFLGKQNCFPTDLTSGVLLYSWSKVIKEDEVKVMVSERAMSLLVNRWLLGGIKIK